MNDAPRGTAAPHADTRKTSKSKHSCERANRQVTKEKRPTGEHQHLHQADLHPSQLSKHSWQETKDVANGTGRNGTTTTTTRSAKDEGTARNSAEHAPQDGTGREGQSGSVQDAERATS